MLEWIFERTAGRGDAVATPIGNLPAPGAIDTEGLDVSKEDMAELLRVDVDEWRAEVPLIRATTRRSATVCRSSSAEQLDALAQRLG